MKEKLDRVLEKIGVRAEMLTLENKIVFLLHLLPALVEDAHVISIGTAGSGKTSLIKKSCSSVSEINSFTVAELFGNKKTMEEGLLTSGNHIAYVEQITAREGTNSHNVLGQDLEKLLLSHCNGDCVSRIEPNKESEHSTAKTDGQERCNKKKARTNLVLLGNPPTFQIDNIGIEFGQDYFKYLSKILLSEQWRERMIFLPSFLMEKLKIEMLLPNSNDSFISNERINYTDYKMESEKFSVREHKEVCKIISCLNYFLNDNQELCTEDFKFKGFLSIAKSILLVKEEKYRPFYFKNREGRILALNLLFTQEEIENIEEAHFLKHRALIKYRNQNFWKKIALNKYGKEENLKENEYFKNNKNSYIAQIFRCSSDGMIVEQEYLKLLTDNLKVIPEGMNGSIEKKLEEKIYKIEENVLKINIFLNQINQSLQSIFSGNPCLYTPRGILCIDDNLILEQRLNSFENEIKMLPDFKVKYLNKRDIGITEEKMAMLNFSDYLD